MREVAEITGGEAFTAVDRDRLSAVYEKLDAASLIISDAVSTAFTEAGVAHSLQRAGSLFSFTFGSDVAPLDYADVQRQEAFRYAPFFHSMLDAGVSLPPSVYEAWFVSAAHDDRAVSTIIDALPAAASAAAAAGGN